eukprot:sb/3467072/
MLLSPLFSEGTTAVGSAKTPTLCIKVPVPTSEHVAEIVGKQGCKIKSLRVSTHTYIQTPARDQPPVFTISGYPEDVERAKRRIEEAADHFTKIRQGRENNSPITPQLGPDAVIKLVEVPFKYVGLVVGPKGHNIKGIQSKTDTFIMTPAKNNAPIFEIRGLPENVAEAEREIHKYIADRTGGGIYDDCENFVDVDLKKPMLPPKPLDGFISPFGTTTPSSLTSKVFPPAGLCKPTESSVLVDLRDLVESPQPYLPPPQPPHRPEIAVVCEFFEEIFNSQPWGKTLMLMLGFIFCNPEKRFERHIVHTLYKM